MQNLKVWIHATLLLIIAVVVRVIKMGAESPGIEEIYASLVALKSPSQYLGAPYIDFCPPLYYLFLHPLGIAGGALWLMRLPSILFGAATCITVFLTGRALFTPPVGLIAGYLLALNPLHVFYSQETQAIAMSCLLAVICFYCLTMAAETQKPSKWLAFDIISIALMHTLREAPFILGSFLILQLLQILFFPIAEEQRRTPRLRHVRTLLLNYAVIVGCSLPWLFIMPNKVPWYIPPPSLLDLGKSFGGYFLLGLRDQFTTSHYAVTCAVLVALLPPLISIIRDLDFRHLATLLAPVLLVGIPFLYSLIERARFSAIRDSAIAVPFFALSMGLLVGRCNPYVRSVLFVFLAAVSTWAGISQGTTIQKPRWLAARDIVEKQASPKSILVFWPDYTLPMGDYYFGDTYEMATASDLFERWAELPQDQNYYFIISQFPSKSAHLYTFETALEQHGDAKVLWEEKLNKLIVARNLNKMNLRLWYDEPRTLNVVDAHTSDTQFIFTAEKPEFKTESFHWQRPDVSYDGDGRRIAWTTTENVELRPKVTLAPGNYILKLHCSPILEQPEYGRTIQRSIALELRTGIEAKTIPQLEKEATIRVPFTAEMEMNELPIHIRAHPLLHLNEPVKASYGIAIYSISVDMAPDSL